MTRETEYPLRNAIRSGDIETALALIASGRHLHEVYEWTPLHEAAQHSSYYDVHLKIVSSLLEHGVSVEAQDEYGNTPLHIAVGDDTNVGIVDLLLKAGADVHACNNRGETPLHCAARADYASPEIIHLLLQYGAHIEVKNNWGQTPFMAAIEASSVNLECGWVSESIEPLIQAGADVNTTDTEGNTPLHVAVTGCYIPYDTRVTEILLASGADTHAENGDGETPIMLAVQKNRRAHIELLLKAECKKGCCI